jgi:DNA-binding CsgD family transcriptional regulator
MAAERITYQNWIADLGRDPSQPLDFEERSRPIPVGAGDFEALNDLEPERRRQIREAVAFALSKLSDNERELIEQFHYMGRSYREIAECSGRSIHRLEALHQRVLKKLRTALAPLVKQLYGLGVSTDPDCPICTSPHRASVDGLIRERNRSDTWRPMIRLLKSRFGIIINTPQTLIGHEKYH